MQQTAPPYILTDKSANLPIGHMYKSKTSMTPGPGQYEANTGGFEKIGKAMQSAKALQ